MQHSPLWPLYPLSLPFPVACPSCALRPLAPLRVPSLPCAWYTTMCGAPAALALSLLALISPPVHAGCRACSPPLSPVPWLCYLSPALDTLQARCTHVTLLRPWPFTFYFGPRGLLWPLGPLALLARPAPPSLLYPFPLPTLCRTLCWQFARTLQVSTWPLPSASDYMRGRLCDITRRLPATATTPAGAAVAGCHSKCRGGAALTGPGCPPARVSLYPPRRLVAGGDPSQYPARVEKKWTLRKHPHAHI